MCSCSNQAQENPEVEKKKVLFVVSNAYYYGESDINTANHFAEIVFAYDELHKAKVEVDFVSPNGGMVPIGYIYSDTLLQQYLHNEKFMGKLKNTKKPNEIAASDYVAIFYAGGGSAMFGVPSDAGIQNIAMEIYEKQEGVVSAVCHGTAGIVHLKKQDGNYLVEGKRINGFPDLFEDKEARYYQEFPFSIEEAIAEHGGTFTYSSEGWDGYLEVDGKLVTGQDPTSSGLVAQQVLQLLSSDPHFPSSK